jgi:hypothetical protein
MNKRKIVYAICVEDIYRTAKDIDQELTEQQVSAISDKLGDYIDWQQAIENAISDCCVKKPAFDENIS